MVTQETTERERPESESELVARAQNAVSACNWTVGDCAASWTKRFARGRTDADFAAMVGLSPDQIYQRRRVAETFGDVRSEYPSLKWSHFYVALNWDDAPECLQWADENESTVAEMKAWRRALRGEDLTEEPAPDEFGGDPSVAFLPARQAEVRDPGDSGRRGGETRTGETARREREEALAGVPRESSASGDDYAPFRRDAGSPAPREEGDVAVVERPRMSAEQLIKRMTTTIERMNKALTPDMIRDVRKLPEKTRARFLQAAGELSSKTAGLM